MMGSFREYHSVNTPNSNSLFTQLHKKAVTTFVTAFFV